MHAYATLGMLALAGSAMAAPSPWGGRGGGGPHVVYETAVVTVIVGPDGQPIYPAGPTPEPQPQPAPAPAEPTMSYFVPEKPAFVPEPEQPAATPAPKPEQPQDSPSEPEQPAPEPEQPAPPTSGDGGYMDTVNTWRAKLGLSELKHDSTLEANAVKTCVDGNGQMKHQLNAGSMGQVLAPGQPGDFEKVFVGGWLCEMPNMPGMDGVCAEMSKGWTYEGQTGHAEILTSPDYKAIGCGTAKGIWGCDLGY